jgi:hypothetical protein
MNEKASSKKHGVATRVAARAGTTLLAIAPALGACQFPTQPWPEVEGVTLTGVVVGSEPVRGAIVEAWRVDGRGVPAAGPLVTTESDAQGRFRIAGEPRLAPPFLVTARRGVTGEYWSGDEVALDDGVQMRAVITLDWLLDDPPSEMPLVISPLTTVAAALAEQRLAEGQAPDYAAAATRAHALLDQHFEIDLRRAQPVRESSALVTAEVRHALVLAGLSGIVHEAALRTGRPLSAMNIGMLTAALVEDARGPGARLDGVGPAGPVALGTCGAECLLPADALRGGLARALAGDFLLSTANETGVTFAEVSEYLLRLAAGGEPELFGDTPGGELDAGAPASALVRSSVLDETRDRIRSAPASAPEHVHDPAAVIDLGDALGDTCPTVYKHADLLHAPELDTNPLRWRFAVQDEFVGLSPGDIEATVRTPAGASAPIVLSTDATRIARMLTAEATVTADAVPELLTGEGRYEITLRARDAAGNEAAPLTACWQHVVLAPPLYAADLAPLGPGSLDDTRFENDNLAPVLRGELTPAGARMLVENNTGAGAYVTLNLDELTGRYQASAIDSRALLRQDGDTDDCLSQGTCSMDPPPEPSNTTIGPTAIPPSFLRLRVVEQGAGREATCAECDPGEFYLAPYGRYEVQAVVADLSFLIPPGMPRDRIAEISVGPLGNAVRLTGIDDGLYVHCEGTDPGGRCNSRTVFQRYRAMTSAIIEVDRLVISARTSAFPKSPPRTPLPAADASNATLSEPVSTSFTWATQDDTLPDPG